MQMLRKLREHLTKSWYMELREKIEARIEAGELTEDTEMSVAWDVLRIDSLDSVEFELELEELSEAGFEPTVEIQTVREFVWLLKAIEFWHERKKRL